jgi:hypothetical protein
LKFLYVDESGDPGKYMGSNTPHYILSGVIIDSENWSQCLDDIVKLRRVFKENYGLPVREEIHAAELIRIKKIDSYRKISKSNRIKILKDVSNEIPKIFRLGKIINICLDKQKVENDDGFAKLAWSRLIQRFDNYLKSEKSKGIIIADDNDETLVRSLLRKMRRYNPVPSHFSGTYNAITDNIVEDPFLRDSKHSYLIQMADVILLPSLYVRIS